MNRKEKDDFTILQRKVEILDNQLSLIIKQVELLMEPTAKFNIGTVTGVGVITRRRFDIKEGWKYVLAREIDGNVISSFEREKDIELRIKLANNK